MPPSPHLLGTGRKARPTGSCLVSWWRSLGSIWTSKTLPRRCIFRWVLAIWAAQCQFPEKKLISLELWNFLDHPVQKHTQSAFCPHTRTTYLKDGRYVPHVHDTSAKALTEAGVQREQRDANHQREEQKLNNEVGCNMRASHPTINDWTHQKKHPVPNSETEHSPPKWTLRMAKRLILKSPRVQPRLASMELRPWGQAPSGLFCISGSWVCLQHVVQKKSPQSL